VKAANDAVPSSLPQSQGQKSDSAPGLDGLILALSQLTEALIQLAMSNEARANAVMSQPDDGGEQESGYLS